MRCAGSTTAPSSTKTHQTATNFVRASHLDSRVRFSTLLPICEALPRYSSAWCVLVHGSWFLRKSFADGTRAARRRAKGAPNLTISTRMRGILLRSRHAGEVAQVVNDTLQCECRKERSDGRAIVTKSIASCLPRERRLLL